MTDTPTQISLGDCVIADAKLLPIFRKAVSEYCTHLLSLLRLVEESSSPATLAGIVAGGHRRFGLRCHLIEEAAASASGSVITFAQARRVIRRALHALPLLFVGTPNARERVTQIAAWLALQHPSYPNLLTVVHDSNWSEGRPSDMLMWEYARTRGPSITLRQSAGERTEPKASGATIKSQIVLTKSQEQAARYLTHYYQLVMHRASLSGYSLRPPLMVGPSGSGKTSVARHMALLLGRPLLEFDMGSWAPQGSRVEVPTIETIRRAMKQHGEVLIYIDEVDKFAGRGQQWYATLNQELFSLIDGRTAGYSGWDDSDRARLANAFIFGGGTFQHLFRERDRRLGFTDRLAQDQTPPDFADQTIPDELLFRFGKTIVVMPPTAKEVAERIGWIRADLGLPAPEPAELARLVADAIESRRGNRWLENYAADQLIDQTASPCWEAPADHSDPTW